MRNESYTSCSYFEKIKSKRRRNLCTKIESRAASKKLVPKLHQDVEFSRTGNFAIKLAIAPSFQVPNPSLAQLTWLFLSCDMFLCALYLLLFASNKLSSQASFRQMNYRYWIVTLKYKEKKVTARVWNFLSPKWHSLVLNLWCNWDFGRPGEDYGYSSLANRLLSVPFLTHFSNQRFS